MADTYCKGSGKKIPFNRIIRNRWAADAAVCPTCKKQYAVNGDGRMRKHGKKIVRNTESLPVCPGTNMPSPNKRKWGFDRCPCCEQTRSLKNGSVFAKHRTTQEIADRYNNAVDIQRKYEEGYNDGRKKNRKNPRWPEDEFYMQGFRDAKGELELEHLRELGDFLAGLCSRSRN